MRKKRFSEEQIIAGLKSAEAGLAVKDLCRQHGITEQTYYRWRKEYGGLKVDQARRLKDLEKENGRLKRLLAEAELDKAILREAASGNF